MAQHTLLRARGRYRTRRHGSTAALSGIGAALAETRRLQKHVQAIERREKRVLVGRDAQRMTLIQRLFPVECWRMLQPRTRRR